MFVHLSTITWPLHTVLAWSFPCFHAPVVWINWLFWIFSNATADIYFSRVAFFSFFSFFSRQRFGLITIKSFDSLPAIDWIGSSLMNPWSWSVSSVCWRSLLSINAPLESALLQSFFNFFWLAGLLGCLAFHLFSQPRIFWHTDSALLAPALKLVSSGANWPRK